MGRQRSMGVPNMYRDLTTPGAGDIPLEDAIRYRLSIEAGHQVPDTQVRAAMNAAREYKGGISQRDDFLNSIDEGLGDRFARSVGQIAGGVAPAVFKQVPLSSILRPGGKAFRIRALQNIYMQWVHRRLAKNATADVSIQTFVQTTNSGRGRFLLDLILGPNSGTRYWLDVATPPGRQYWPSKNPLWIPQLVTPSTRGETMDYVRSLSGNRGQIVQDVRAVLNHDMNKAGRNYPSSQAEIDAFDAQKMYLNNRLPNNLVEVAEGADFVREYLARQAGLTKKNPEPHDIDAALAGFDDAAMTRVLGKTGAKTPRDLVHAILEARNAMRFDAHAYANAHLGASAIKDLVGEGGDPTLALLRLGFDDKFTLSIRSSGFEHGNVYEVDLGFMFEDAVQDAASGAALTRLLGTGLQVIGRIEQHTLNALQSCDWLLKTVVDGVVRIFPAEAKSVSDGLALIGFGGAYFKQFASFHRRIHAASKVTPNRVDGLPDLDLEADTLDFARLVDHHPEMEVVWRENEMPHLRVIDGEEPAYHPLLAEHHFFSDEGRMGRSAHRVEMSNPTRNKDPDILQLISEIEQTTGLVYQVHPEATPDAATLQAFIQGLPDGPLKAEAISMRVQFPDEAYAIAKTARVVADHDQVADAFTEKLRRMLRHDSTDPAVVQADLNWIVSNSSQKVRDLSKNGKTVYASELLGAVRDDPGGAAHRTGVLKMQGLAEDATPNPITVRQMMAMRIALDPNSGKIDFEHARKLLAMPDGISIYHHMHSSEVMVF